MITEPCCVHEVVKRFGMWCGYVLNLIGVLKSQLREQTVGVLHVVSSCCLARWGHVRDQQFNSDVIDVIT